MADVTNIEEFDAMLNEDEMGIINQFRHQIELEKEQVYSQRQSAEPFAAQESKSNQNDNKQDENSEHKNNNNNSSDCIDYDIGSISIKRIQNSIVKLDLNDPFEFILKDIGLMREQLNLGDIFESEYGSDDEAIATSPCPIPPFTTISIDLDEKKDFYYESKRSENMEYSGDFEANDSHRLKHQCSELQMHVTARQFNAASAVWTIQTQKIGMDGFVTSI